MRKQYDRGEVREILEAIATNAFTSVGYDAEPNAEIPNQAGTTTEVDVWATSPKQDLTVYVSCKNHEGGIGGPEIDDEIGRVTNLDREPNLKLVIASGFNGRAKQSAHAHGFLTIATEGKATPENAIQIESRIKKRLRGNLNFPDTERYQELEFQASELTSLETVTFEKVPVKAAATTITFWDCGDTRPVQIMPILNVLDDFYGKERREYVNDLFGFDDDTLLHIFDRGGVVAIEDYNRETLIVRVPVADRGEFLRQAVEYDDEAYDKLYRVVGIR